MICPECGQYSSLAYCKLCQPKPKKKKGGEKDLFLEIWNERPHVSEVSGKPIKEFDIRCFSHTLTKGAYPSMRLSKKNIVLMTPEEHHEWEFTDRKDPKWDKIKKLEQELKQEYYNA
jgi:hypothetical protein